MANPFSKISNLFKRKVQQVKQSVAAFSSTKWGDTSWTPKDYKNFAEESYMKNVIAFRCMDYLSKSVASVPFKLYRKIDDKREEVNNHPIVNVLTRPNPYESWEFLMIKSIVYLLISGNSFYNRVTPMTGINKGIPKELYVLRPDKFKIKTDKNGFPVSYIYSIDNDKIIYPIDPITGQGDILQLKLFNPVNDLWGMSITEPTAREIDSYNEATEMNKKVFENEGRPGMMVFVKGSLTEEQWNRLEKQMKDKYAGSMNSGKTMILESDYETKVSPYSWTPKEMDFLESKKDLARNICLGYGVPPMLLGIPGDNTYSNYQEARQAFWEETVFFYLNYQRGELNNWIFTENDKLFIDYDLNNVPALQAKRDKLWERAQKSDFMEINEKREMVGLERKDGGDVILVSANMIPLSLVGAANETEPNSEEEDESKKKELIKLTGMSEEKVLELMGVKEYNND